MESSLDSGMGSVLMASWGRRKTTGVAGREGMAETAEVEDIFVKSRGYVVEVKGGESSQVTRPALKNTFFALVFFGLRLRLNSAISSLVFKFFSGSHELSLVGYPFHLTR